MVDKCPPRRMGEVSGAVNAYGAFLGIQPVEQSRFQFFVQRQHRRLKPPAQKGVGNRLDADTLVLVHKCGQKKLNNL